MLISNKKVLYTDRDVAVIRCIDSYYHQIVDTPFQGAEMYSVDPQCHQALFPPPNEVGIEIGTGYRLPTTCVVVKLSSTLTNWQ